MTVRIRFTRMWRQYPKGEELSLPRSLADLYIQSGAAVAISDDKKTRKKAK